MRILLVEDDSMIGETLQLALRDAGYAADWVKNGQVALNVLATEPYDLLLLDLGLPGKDGIEVIKTLRQQQSNLPILVISARDATEDRIKGLDAGADDYVVKPFDLSELKARIRAVYRRKAGGVATLLSNPHIVLNPADYTAQAIGQSTAHQLSKREYALLEALMIRPGAILSRSDLESRIYGWGEEIESNVVEFLIHALRKKLGNHVIKNVRGVGWMVSKNS